MHLKECSHLTFAFASTSPSKFNIVSMETQTQTHRMDLNLFLTFYIDAENGFRPILCVCVCVSIDTMLNYDGDVDANANACTYLKALFTRNVFSPFLLAAPLIFFTFCNVICEHHHHRKSFNPFKMVRKTVQKSFKCKCNIR